MMSGRETKRKRMKQRKSADSIAVEAGNTFFIPARGKFSSTNETD